jgi:uncharacterized protein (TIGR00369 family)
MSERAPSKVTGDEFLGLLRATIPTTEGVAIVIEEMREGLVRVRRTFGERHTRAGGTLAGPAVMMLADLALYGMVLSVAGLEPLAVTTDLSFHFLRKPEPRDLVAEARLLKHGRKLVVGEVSLWSAGTRPEEDAVAHCVGTYALPTPK